MRDCFVRSLFVTNVALKNPLTARMRMFSRYLLNSKRLDDAMFLFEFFLKSRSFSLTSYSGHHS